MAAAKKKKSPPAKKAKKTTKSQKKAAEYVSCLKELHNLQGVLLSQLSKEI